MGEMPHYTFSVLGDKQEVPEVQSEKRRGSGWARNVLYNPPDTRRLRFLAIRPQAASDPVSEGAGRQRDARIYDEYGIVGNRENPIDEVNIDYVLTTLNGQVTSNDSTIHKRFGAPNNTLEAQKRPRPLFVAIVRQSALVHQLESRISVLSTAIRIFQETLPSTSVSVQDRSRVYMRFWNSVWLILNDLILGFCARRMMLESMDYLSTILLDLVKVGLVETPIRALEFLDDWPLGLKLNTPLSGFFCSIFTRSIDLWSEWSMPILRNNADLIVTMAATSGLFGLTFLFGALWDLSSLLTLHLRVAYLVTSFIFNLQRDSLSGLFNLFRGKRWNVLRQRIDSYQYDIDQLFLGTVLFTVSIFLMPTTMAYAGLFAGVQLGLRLSAGAVSKAVQALNAFPLFEVMLRVKEPSRLPAGVFFDIVGTESRPALQTIKGRAPATHVLYMQSSPKSLVSIFRSAAVQSNRLNQVRSQS